MAKWSFAAIAAVAALALPGSDAQAQKIAVALDGCAVLARTVYEEVSSASLYGPGGSGPWYIGPRMDEIFECGTVARTVSRAFTHAMASAGYHVRWSENSDDRGDYCLSMYLSQCYPNRREKFVRFDDVDNDLVRRSWSLVSQSVMREMANPYSSDEVRFNDEQLKLRIGLALRSVGGQRARHVH